MKKVIQIMIVFIFLPGVHSNYNNISACPECERKWKERAAVFKCSITNYHCILDTDGNRIETCITPSSIPPNRVGCPYVQIINGRAFLRADRTTCPSDNSYCPTMNHARYSTNELYKHPICLVRESDRINYQGHCCSPTENNKYVTQDEATTSGEGVTRECPNITTHTCRTCHVVIGVLLTMLVLAVTFLIATQLKRRKGENPGFQHLIPQKNLQYQGRKRHFVLLESISKDSKGDLEKTTQKLSCLDSTTGSTEATCYLCTIASPLLYAALMKKKTAFNFLIERTKFDSMTGEQKSEILHYCLVNDWLDLLHKSATLRNNVYIPGKERLRFVRKDDFVQNGRLNFDEKEDIKHVYVTSQKLEMLKNAYTFEREEE